MKTKHINLATYDDFEKLNTFAGNIDAYRTEKLKSAAGHVSFIKKLFPKKKITVLELGSGNSKTLFALEKAGVLHKGYGLEISKSRYEFAQLWKKEWGFKLIENRNEDALRITWSDFLGLNLCFIVDLTLQFFEAVEKGSSMKILKSVYRSLERGGKVIIEVDGLGKVLSKMHGKSVRFWEEFAEPDPWRYSLWDCAFDHKNKMLDIKKVFVKRNEYGISENRMVLRVYSKVDMQKLLKQAGFSHIAFYADWRGGKFKDDKGEYIIVGTK